jgi:GNAT superfamily N-acetyltransferase
MTTTYSSPFDVRPLSDPTVALPLAGLAREEGFGFLDRLIHEWQSGENRFEKDGEVLYGVFVGDELIATGGMTRQGVARGRVRRVYVHPDYRRRGVASRLLDVILEFARLHYPEVVLYTNTERASRFYERLGFVPESPDWPDRATHRLVFRDELAPASAG